MPHPPAFPPHLLALRRRSCALQTAALARPRRHCTAGAATPRPRRRGTAWGLRHATPAACWPLTASTASLVSRCLVFCFAGKPAAWGRRSWVEPCFGACKDACSVSNTRPPPRLLCRACPAAVGPNDVRIQITHCGICHSDLHQIRGEWGNSTFPMVSGLRASSRCAAVVHASAAAECLLPCAPFGRPAPLRSPRALLHAPQAQMAPPPALPLSDTPLPAPPGLCRRCLATRLWAW